MRARFSSSIFLALFAYSSLAQASWELNSEFRLHWNNQLTDQLVQSLGQSIASGSQTVTLPDVSLTDPAPVTISGISLAVQYSFLNPVREGNSFNWDVKSQSVGAKLLINSVNAETVIQKVVNGVIVNIKLNAECHNIELDLSPNGSSIQATVNASIQPKSLNLTLTNFNASWADSAWNVVSIDCTGAEGFSEIVKQQTLQYLSSLHNSDDVILGYLNSELEAWSAQASSLLLAPSELPTNRPDLRIFYNPVSASPGENGGMFLQGTLGFFYPNAGKTGAISEPLSLDQSSLDNDGANSKSELLLPKEILRGLLIGEYFSKNLDYNQLSDQLPGFSRLMDSRFLQFFVWPDLMGYPKDSVFLLNFQVPSPPNLANLANASDGKSLSALLTMPMLLQGFAPKNKTYIPYVEFFTNLVGKAKLSIDQNKVAVSFAIDSLDFQQSWAKSYLARYQPNQWIWTKQISSALQAAIRTQGIEFSLPSLSFGPGILLVPESWSINGGNLFLNIENKPALPHML